MAVDEYGIPESGIVTMRYCRGLQPSASPYGGFGGGSVSCGQGV
ncbi:hypothetical protein [Treponema endosymbiont of Eucomonympha sp.]|nr:hypothetical protein [Treponema endosymbiont of Eucomonympha sp.]